MAFEPQDVQDTICEFFEWMAERFDSDHWKLSERQARMLGKPSAILADAMWRKLTALLPDIIGQWCESTPGATAFLFAFGIVVVPKVKKQFTISRERARRSAQTVRRMPSPVTPAGSPIQPMGAPGGAVHSSHALIRKGNHESSAKRDLRCSSAAKACASRPIVM